MRPSSDATSACGLELLVHEALSFEIYEYFKETSEGTSLDLLVHEASILMIASGSDGEGQQDSGKEQVDVKAEEVNSRQIPSLSSQMTVELRRDIPIQALFSGTKQAIQCVVEK